MIQVFTSNNTPLNRMANTLPATSGEDTNYNRNFGGWYVTKIYDYTSQKDAGHPYGTTYISIEYDMGTALESQASSVAASHAIKRISDSLGRVIEFMNECAPTGCQQIPVANNNSDRSSIRTTSITIPAFTSTATTAVYSFAYAWRAINNIDADQVCPQTCDVNPNHCQLNCPNTSANVLTDIIYPPFSNHSGSKLGYRMTFDYGPYDPLQNGEIYSRTLPTGAQIAYQWGVYYYLSGGTRQLTRKILYMIPGGPINGDWTYTR